MILFSPIWLLLLVPLGAALYSWQLPTRGLNILRGIIGVLLVLRASLLPRVFSPRELLTLDTEIDR